GAVALRPVRPAAWALSRRAAVVLRGSASVGATAVDTARARRTLADAQAGVWRARLAGAAPVVLGDSAGGCLLARAGKASSLFDSLDGALGDRGGAGGGPRLGTRRGMARVSEPAGYRRRRVWPPRRRDAALRRPQAARRAVDAGRRPCRLAALRLCPELVRQSTPR